MIPHPAVQPLAVLAVDVMMWTEYFGAIEVLTLY